MSRLGFSLWNLFWVLTSLSLLVHNFFCCCYSFAHIGFLYFVPSLWVRWVLCMRAVFILCVAWVSAVFILCGVWGWCESAARKGVLEVHCESAFEKCVGRVPNHCYAWVCRECNFSSTVVRCFVLAGLEVLLLSAVGFIINYQFTLWTCKLPLFSLPYLLGAIAYVGLDLGFCATFVQGLSMVCANLSPKQRSKWGSDFL